MYELCAQVNLQRQVGSRYFVSANNAARIIFLAKAAVEFIRYTGKDSGNNLEVDVYTKLMNEDELSKLRADALLYYHVYADLVMLSKSKALNISVLDMNNHYFELLCFLNDVLTSPELLLVKNYRVFQSESRLYGNSTTTNHRIHKNASSVYDKVFELTPHEKSALLSMIIPGVTRMKEKLLVYAEKHLPAGKYWDPEPSVKEVLAGLKPSNDFCESILGLNDYLTTALPNLTQASRSNLVQVKKKHTMQWLDTLPEKDQVKVLNLAVQERPRVVAAQQQCVRHC